MGSFKHGPKLRFNGIIHINILQITACFKIQTRLIFWFKNIFVCFQLPFI